MSIEHRNVKKLLKRSWRWGLATGVQHENHIKTLEQIIIHQNKRITELEKKLENGE